MFTLPQCKLVMHKVAELRAGSVTPAIGTEAEHETHSTD
jgi:hypothetical protein